MDAVVKAIGQWSCEVINGVNGELANIKSAVESMDSGMVQGTEKLQNSLNERLDSMDEKLGDIHEVLEQIRDALKKEKRK